MKDPLPFRAAVDAPSAIADGAYQLVSSSARSWWVRARRSLTLIGMSLRYYDFADAATLAATTPTPSADAAAKAAASTDNFYASLGAAFSSNPPITLETDEQVLEYIENHDGVAIIQDDDHISFAADSYCTIVQLRVTLKIAAMIGKNCRSLFCFSAVSSYAAAFHYATRSSAPRERQSYDRQAKIRNSPTIRKIHRIWTLEKLRRGRRKAVQ